MFSFNAVSKSFGGVGAVRDLSLDVPAGRTTVLIGPSGCGKSTLLRLGLGLAAPDAGHIIFDGIEVDAGSAEQLRRRMGYVIQSGGLFPHMTAGDNAVLMARHIGWSSGQIKTRLGELLALTRLHGDLLDRYPIELSGGQRQRVALIRGLMLDPDILLLDEPFGSLDPMVRYSLQTELRDIFRSLQKTVLMVTHDIAEAAYFGDMIFLMRDGAEVQHGSIDDLLHRPADGFVTQFVTAQRTLTESVREPHHD